MWQGLLCKESAADTQVRSFVSWRTVALRQCPLDLSVRLKRQVFKVDIGGQVFGRRFYRLGGGGGRGGGGEPEGMEGEGRRARAGGGPEDIR